MAEREARKVEWRELITVLLLSVTAILTAWTGFESSKWGGAMSIAFSQASTARIEAARFDADANRRQNIQVGLFAQWAQAYSTGNDQLATFYETRFPEPLDAAFKAWIATKPLKNPAAPDSPFSMKEYAIPETALAEQADARADLKYSEALRNNQRGDNYTVLTIGFAVVLFFGALSSRLKGNAAQWALLGIGIVGFLVLTTVLSVLPKLI